MRKTEMLTITQLIERQLTTFTPRHVQKLVKDGAITGVEVVGKTLLIPLTKSNLKALDRQRKPKSTSNNKDVKTN